MQTELARRLAVYVVTTRTTVPTPREHRDIAAAALAGGATAVQLRAPELTGDETRAIAAELAAECRRRGALFIVNDRVDVGASSAADGVHLGQSDDPTGARERLRPGQVLGISVARIEELPQAVAAGADYVGVTVWPTLTKAGAVPVGLETVRAVVEAGADTLGCGDGAGKAGRGGERGNFHTSRGGRIELAQTGPIDR